MDQGGLGEEGPLPFGGMLRAHGDDSKDAPSIGPPS